ncbi:MmcQ/YjbR family DNA-binding protein [Sphingorhabdus sp. Alg239-R122]|uniref:MmcQ/YjbR family DNA-binding protein n=1 Tax=Sphingorhabdus sp. Alg239-R122 TaxID=2305989 RepID=UPI0013DB02A2|nr:MmcQ/YjbR family DNA-binding protein [Sphingorhabdus sp. Alg239-R122]
MKTGKATDPTEDIRLKASQYADVDEGTSCTQAAFKTGNKAFLYIGEQGGRYKAMFKLEKSRKDAEELASKAPDDYQVGKAPWVTARFTSEKPMPQPLWEKWLDESYALTATL